MAENCSHNCGSCSQNCGDRIIEKKKPLPSTHINKIIGVLSGKGGVGKSMVSSLLAVELAKNKIGTTKRGIGPCYADKYTRIGIRVGDLKDFSYFKERLENALLIKNEIIKKVYNEKPFDFDTLVNEFSVIREKLIDRIVDSGDILNKALSSGKKVLFEGAQANMLDINYGTYPYVTSSSPTSGGVITGAGVSPKYLENIIGVVKAYSTRVGEGPFVSEQLNADGDLLREVGG